jgi:LmbE family N-acetylglucosaminyl deacetylase
MADKWIYLSPHFDDAVFSAGGLIWEQVQQGCQVEIWTICAREPPADQPLSDFARELHAIWDTGQTPVPERAREDIQSCLLLGVTHRHLPWLDCIYRVDPGSGMYYVQKEEDLYEPYNEDELDSLTGLLGGLEIPQDAQVAVPFGIGSHRDHTVVRAVAEKHYGKIWHYPDFPYVMQKQVNPASFVIEGSLMTFKPQFTSQSLQAWKDAIACHHSQLPVFWKDIKDMQAAIDLYADTIQKQNSGTLLWKF